MNSLSYKSKLHRPIDRGEVAGDASQDNETETSLAVQWLGLGTLTAEDPGLIPGQGTKILQAVNCSQKKKKVT